MLSCAAAALTAALMVSATASATESATASPTASPTVSFSAPADAPPAPRVEARSRDFLAVGLVNGDRMSIHVSRLADNSPVRDATLAVMLRGALHPTVAEPDGSYMLETKDLELPGTASLEFQIAQGQVRTVLTGELVVGAAGAKPVDQNSARQLWWWVLNFAVCIGFLKLWSARRKAAAAREHPAGE